MRKTSFYETLGNSLLRKPAPVKPLKHTVGLDASIALVIHFQCSQSVWMGQAKTYRRVHQAAIEGEAHGIFCP
jgi:hypothetical protein